MGKPLRVSADEELRFVLEAHLVNVPPLALAYSSAVTVIYSGDIAVCFRLLHYWSSVYDYLSDSWCLLLVIGACWFR